MDNRKTLARILGSGIYNLDTNVVREYPDGPGSRRFTETVLGDEVGGTCGNEMCILAGLGLETYPQACLDDSPDFYFFDDPAAGHRYVAGALRERGTTVYFEPARVETNADLESVRCSDIVKFSNENIPDASFADGFRDKLFVQTLGKEGLRYKFLDGDWKTLPPVVNAHVVDTEGAGDATTSAIISGIARSGKRFRDLDETELVRILTDAQQFASESVSRMGTKAITT